MKLIVKAALVAVILNVVLPLLVAPFATETEINACIKDDNLNLKERFMVMLLHHKHMPVMSSAIVALVVVLSIVLGGKLRV
tara:strand:+ start:516 stop:758 length:243 start_codon:yes stop_codon:yes gene_type:complete